MKAVTGYEVIKPDDLQWRLSGLMQIPNADFLERTGSNTLTVPKHGGVLVCPEKLELLPSAAINPDLSLVYPKDPTQLPPELAGKQWPPNT